MVSTGAGIHRPANHVTADRHRRNIGRVNGSGTNWVVIDFKAARVVGNNSVDDRIGAAGGRNLFYETLVARTIERSTAMGLTNT